MDILSLSTPIQNVSKIGPTYQKRLKKFGIKTVQDILFHFPSRYNDFSDIISISEALGKSAKNVCIQGEVIKIKDSRTFRKWMSLTEVIVKDENAEIKVIWFNQPYMTKTLKEGDFVCLAGKISSNKEGVYLSNPIYEKINEWTKNDSLTHTGRIIPVYPETKGVTSRWFRFIIKPLLVRFVNIIPESLPPEIIKKYRFLPTNEAL